MNKRRQAKLVGKLLAEARGEPHARVTRRESEWLRRHGAAVLSMSLSRARIGVTLDEVGEAMRALSLAVKQAAVWIAELWRSIAEGIEGYRENPSETLEEIASRAAAAFCRGEEVGA